MGKRRKVIRVWRKGCWEAQRIAKRYVFMCDRTEGGGGAERGEEEMRAYRHVMLWRRSERELYGRREIFRCGCSN